MSLNILTNVPLATYTTLQVGGPAEYLVEVGTTKELQEAVSFAEKENLQIRVLGGGSNVLVPDEGLTGLVIINSIKGISHEVNGDSILLTAGAGEVFDEVVSFAVEEGWWGIENLSHIPGSVGATPVQNVGAYGVEVKGIVSEVEVFDTSAGTIQKLSATDCDFSYRDSLFKHEEGKKYIVTSVTFVLSATPRPVLHYKDLQALFLEKPEPSIKEVRDAIIAIRSKKFPDWNVVGTAGSFFKNPIITKEKFESLKNTHPDLPGHETDDGTVKVALGWVLDKVLNMKGIKDGAVGTYEGQALVLVHTGGATASEIELFARGVVDTIKEELDIDVEWEVTKLL